ncbi:MAG: PAS-domain containing protein [Pseudomonadota bacterium]
MSKGAAAGAAPPPPLCAVTLSGDRIVSASGAWPSDPSIPLTPGAPARPLTESSDLDPALAAGLTRFLDTGEAAILHLNGRDGRLLRLEMSVSRLRGHLTFHRASPGEAALYHRLAETEAPLAETARLRARAENGPVIAFETDAAGALTWANDAAAAYLRTGAGKAALQALAPGTGDGQTQLRSEDGTQLGWVRVSTVPTDDGRTITYLEDIDAQARAEQSLESFMSTLTETFAHLDIALAIFDRERQLSLFNPALTNLFGLDPVALAQRMSFREFVEALRQNRMVPEQSDFTAWRRRLAEVCSTAAETPYGEDWTLPSGQVIRVSARPHPRGAIAFVFEDISRHVNLERRYRAEVELGQATLDRLRDGVAMFSSSGQVLFSNDAFNRALGVDALDTVMDDGIDGVIAAAETSLGDGATWQEFKRFALAAERSGQWDCATDPTDGTAWRLRASALPDGSTLLMVSHMADAGGRPQPIPMARVS